MQSLLASLVIGMSVKDAAFKAGMGAARAEVKKTGQDFDRGADQMSGAIERAARTVQMAAVRMVDGLTRAGDAVQRQGLKLTAGLTLPLGLLAHTAKETASDFQAAMNNVHAAMLDADPAQLEKLRQAALLLGPAMGKSAIEAAGAIEALAKNGMGAADILSGGLEDALKLGVLGQTDLGKAADATTDILQQFHLTTGALPGVVNKVSGALDASKLDFNGYADAIGMVGGIAGGLGYSFDDMNTALAAVIPLMTGGSDAGTSFKTFLLSLVPQSKEAAGVMDKLGISFKNSDGTMKTLGEAAEVLNTKLAGLTDASRQDALTKMFGTDGMRVALALMQAGAKGVADVQAQIDKANADQKIAVLLDGEAAATQRLASAWEQLKIAIGSAGIIQAFTMIKNAGAAVLSGLAVLPSWLFSLAAVVGVAAASIGPLMLAALGLAKIALPLLLLRLGPVALGFAAIINPAGVAIRLLGQLAMQVGAATVISRLGTAMLGFAGPIGLVVTGLSIMIPYLLRAGEASAKATAAGDALSKANAGVAQTATQLAGAEGKARDAILQKAKADRIGAANAIQAARADMIAARAAYARTKAAAPTVQGAAKVGSALSGFGGIFAAGGLAAGVGGYLGGRRATSDAGAELKQRIDNTGTAIDTFNKLDALIKGAEGGGGSPKVDMSFDDDGVKKTRKTRAAKDRTEKITADFENDLGQASADLLRAKAELEGGYRAAYTADIAAIEQERASYARTLKANDDLTEARRSQLLAAKDAELAVRREIAEQTRFRGEYKEGYDLAQAENAAMQDRVRIQIDTADSIAGRRDGELRLLDLQRRQEEADLDLVLATEAQTSAAWDNARKEKAGLDAKYAARADAANRQNEGPAAAYMRGLNRSSAAVAEDIERSGVDALRDLNTGLTEAVMGTAKLADAFQNMGKRIVASLIDIAVQQAIIKPLANTLFGAADAGGKRSGGLIGSIGPILAKSFGGGKAKGGPIDPSRWYVVGEQGPELFAPGVSGTVIPNGGKGNRSVGMTIHAPLYLTGAVDLATKTEARQYARAHAAEVAQAMFQQNRRRAGRP